MESRRSEQNMQVVRAFLDAFERRDYERCLEIIDLDVEWHPPPDIPNAHVCHGRDEFVANWRDWLGAWESYRFTADAIRAGSDDTVLVLGSEQARGRESGIDAVSRRVTGVFEVRNDRIVRCKAYLDRGEAFAAAGLSESETHDGAAEPQESSMPQSDVAMVREGYAEWQRTRSLDFELLHPDVEWIIHGTPAGDITYRGRAEVAEWFAEQDAAYSDQWWTVEEVREMPNNRVLALVVAHAIGRGSGVSVELELANIWTIVAGQVTRLEIFVNRGEALDMIHGGR